MKFKYKARTKQGEEQVGFVEAPEKDSAATILQSHDLFVLGIESTEKRKSFEWLRNYFGRVRRKDMVSFTRQMAVLFSARISLTDVLKTLYEQTSHPVLKESVYQISQDVDSGMQLSQALESQPNIFSQFFVSMVRAAELTGNLEQAMEFLADYVEKEDEMAGKIKSAMVYPSVIIALFVAVAFIMLTVVFPQIAPVFEESGVELPFFTSLLISIGSFLGQWWFFVLILFVMAIFLFIDYMKSEEGKILRDDILARTPFVKRLYFPIVVTRISNASSMLLRGGVPVAQAVTIVSQTIDNELYKDILSRVAQEVREGERLAEAIKKYPNFFPPLVSQMLAVGESTGQIDQMFERISTFYSREADEAIKTLIDLIQPALMVGVGVLVGLLFASILLPLYQLTATI